MKWADAAMYRAKDAGRNSVWIHQGKNDLQPPQNGRS
jgi:hypothetical protein